MKHGGLGFGLILILWLTGCAGVSPGRLPPLTDLSGHQHPMAALAGGKATVLVFLSVDCPIANRCLPELVQLARETETNGVRFVHVYANSADGNAAIRQHRAEFGLFPEAYRDPGWTLAVRLGVRVTPEVVALASDGKLIYQGRVNDQYAALGQGRPAATRHDLAEALSGYLAGDPPSGRVVPAVGCSFRGP